MNDCKLSGNMAGSVGGALAAVEVAAVSIRDSRLIDNSARGGGGGGLAIIQVECQL